MVEPQHETHQHAQANGSIDVEMTNGSHVTADGSSTDSTDGGADTSTATADLNGNVSPSANKSLQVALAELVSKEVAQYAPLLIGKYYVQDKRAVWAGRWGMTEAAFGPSGVTSAFEMKSDEDVYVRTCASEDPSTVHPVFADGFLAKSSRVENPDATSIHPGYIGYERDPAERSAMPFDCKYSGFFQIQAVKGKPQTVTEKSVEIRFVHNASRPSHFYVSGLGENKFGVFNLVGLLDKETSEMRLYKIYKPKEKEKRTPLPKRTRAAAAKPPVPAASTVVKLPVAAAPPPPPPAPVAVPSQTLPPLPKMPALSVARPSVSTPMGSDTSTAPSPFTVSRGRSERKIIQPARLRDENILDHDQTPTSLKKCHAILKSLMANPKAGPFLVPVDPVALGIPDYFNVIKEPMDLGTIRQNLEGGYYTDAYVFIDHVRLVFDNARLYNAAHSQVHIYAAKLSEDFEKRIKNLSTKTSKDKSVERVFGSGTPTTSIIKLKRDRKGEPTHSTKKIKGGRGAKGNSKRAISEGNEGLIMSLKEDIERLKATLEQLQPNAVRTITPKPSKGAARPFKMEDLTEEELNEPMTQAEKARLSEDIRQLPQDKINRVLQIIAESVPVSKLTNENDEVEIDINSFDSRCLRMLEGYVRENGIGRKRKRPTAKSSKSAPVSHRLKSAKVAAVHIRERKEHVKHQLARMDGNGATEAAKTGVPAYTADVDMEKADQDNSSSDSSSDSSDSSDSDSDSDSESDSDAGAPLQRSPTLTGGSTLSQLSETARAEAAKKIRDEASTREPLKVENRGAWSLLAQKETNSQSLMLPEENQTSSLWMSARSMEQIKQQKIQQKERERTDEIEAQRRREVEQREKEKEREREELERRKKEQDAALHQARQEQLREERVRQAERAHVAERVSEREKVVEDDEFGESHDLTEDLESFSSSSFL